jgi:hypothetical protein
MPFHPRRGRGTPAGDTGDSPCYRRHFLDPIVRLEDGFQILELHLPWTPTPVAAALPVAQEISNVSNVF